jgi:uncharacterized SAM-binding protein YcdF (DUF218 family)
VPDAQDQPSKKRRFLRRIGVFVCWGSLGLSALVLAALCFPHWFLQVETHATRADVIVVLGGEPVVRVERAVELYQAGIAPKIIVSGQGDCSENIRQLVEAGVPRSAILADRTSRTTLENARNCAPLLTEMHAERAVIVTSWYHSRRALACFETAAPGVEMLSLPSRSRDATPRQYILNEYLKLGYYAAKHGIWPFAL